MWNLLAPSGWSESRAKAKNKDHPREGPAPVLAQWKLMQGRPALPRLLVLDFNRDKANIKGRFFESYPLSDALLGQPETVATVPAVAVRMMLAQHRPV